METPICKECAWSGQLCPQCNASLKSGEISSLDVDVSKILYKINEKHNISEAKFSKALDFGGQVVLLTKGEVGMLIGRQGKVVSALSLALGKKVRVVKFDGDVKRSIADMLSPVRLLGMNDVWAGGKEVLRIRVPKEERGRIYVEEDVLKDVIKSWMKKEVELIFE